MVVYDNEPLFWHCPFFGIIKQMTGTICRQIQNACQCLMVIHASMLYTNSHKSFIILFLIGLDMLPICDTLDTVVELLDLTRIWHPLHSFTKARTE